MTKLQLTEAYSLLLSIDEEKIQELVDDATQPLAIRLIIGEMTDPQTRGRAIQDMRNYLFGNATTTTDITTKGESINHVNPTEIMENITKVLNGGSIPKS